MTDETPIIEVTIAAPVDAVWRALRDTETIRHWHGWEFDGLDQEIDLIYLTKAVEGDDHRSLTLGQGDLFELFDEGAATRVRITRAPLSGDAEWDAYYDDVTEGWTTFLHQLRFALEHHPGEPRRTLFYSGFYSGYGEPPNPAEPAAPADGVVWFETAKQRGLRIPEWGDGLLVTAYNPAKRTAMAVLTTYGLDDPALAELDARWSPWWSARYSAEP
ncbi:MAG: SRPBCC family protein [Nocardioides sp.]